MSKLCKKDLFDVHRRNIKNIIVGHAGNQEKAIDEITEYIMARISQIIRKERQATNKRIAEMQWRDKRYEGKSNS